jgi:hypothetical protein
MGPSPDRHSLLKSDEPLYSSEAGIWRRYYPAVDLAAYQHVGSWCAIDRVNEHTGQVCVGRCENID